jgi:hypothetical protein
VREVAQRLWLFRISLIKSTHLRRRVCGYTFVFATIDAMIKAFGGPPVAETIGGLLCTQARALAAQQAPKGAVATEQGSAVVLGTVIINGKPVTITVLR